MDKVCYDKVNEILNSNMSNNDKIEALNEVKKLIKDVYFSKIYYHKGINILKYLCFYAAANLDIKYYQKRLK